MSITVNVKHAGNTHAIAVDSTTTATAFKNAIYRVTGVPVDRMKVMIRGGILKDHADVAALGLKEGQAITVIGSAGPLPSAPSQPTVFLEDLDEDSMHFADSPPGLVNLGQTCYLNSTLQALRVAPQIRTALDSFSPSTSSPQSRLTTSVKNLFTGLSQTSAAVPPFVLLNNLRALVPQFAEQDNHGHFSQQDADEAWTQIVSALRTSLAGTQEYQSAIDQSMSVELTGSLKCVDAPDEPPTNSKEAVLKLECNISISTNFLLSGLLDSLDQRIEKTSPTLGRMAMYEQKSRLSRLPTNLVIHMVRFYWRRDIQKKAKIMRKVKFPLQLDVTDIVTDELRDRIRPVNTTVKQILKDRDDRARQAKKTLGKSSTEETVVSQKAAEEKAAVAETVQQAGFDAVNENASGIYELSAMITHKGASADSGHYIGWTRKESSALVPSGEEEWFKFDDDKVSTVTADKILSLDGGGEDSVAYILLYRAVDI